MKDYKTLYGSLVTGDWPATVAKNASGPLASDGTPFTADLINDLWGGRIDLMVRASLTPDGVTEANATSQFVAALHRVIRGPGEIVLLALNTTTLATRRIIALTGQIITIANYAELCAAVYCGDADNPTAPAFYKTSDAGGTTRSTTGGYMVFPDARGLVVRGLGSNSKITAANGSTYSGGTKIGELLTDMFAGHIHRFMRPTGTVGVIAQYDGTAAGAANDSFARGSGTSIGTLSIDVTPYNDGTNGSPRYGTETRGASMGAQICITY